MPETSSEGLGARALPPLACTKPLNVSPLVFRTYLPLLAGTERNTVPKPGWDLPPLALHGRGMAGGTELCC